MKLTFNSLSPAGHIIVALLPVLTLQSLITFAESRMHKTRPVRTLDYKHRAKFADVFGHPAYNGMQKFIKRSGDGPPAGGNGPPSPPDLPPLFEDVAETITDNTNNTTNKGGNGSSRHCVSAIVILLPLLTTLNYIHCIRV
ncbi:uncharacterized protein [Amphiura filiformis]|uniref:uncharacterized protein n=1 Tax=Amphiura filiformis TaxID=82378 RepID=UPI003B2123CD